MNHKPLLDAEENWETSIGAWFPDQTVFLRGKDLFTDLYSYSWMKLLLFAITGRTFSDKQVELLDRIWALTVSYPDPRIWNNRIAALAGSSRATGILGTAGATAVSEAIVYGKQADIRAVDFITRLKEQCDAGADIESYALAEMKEKRFLGGFGHPLVKRDPRVLPVLKLLEELGFEHGPYVKLVLELETILQKTRYRMSPNVAGLVAAIGLDQGLSMREYYNYTTVAFSIGFIACHLDALEHPEGSFFPLRCTRIDYQGVAPRQWKRS